MCRLPFIRTWSCILILVATSALTSFAAQPGTLSVGAARVDITPPADAALPMQGYQPRNMQGIHDHIYVRAIVLSDGTHEAAILAWELIGMPTPVWRELSQHISKELGIPADHLILAAEHVHSAPSVAWAYEKGSPETMTYTAKLQDAAFEAVRQAQANLQPARFGFGSGKAYVNINRREFYPKADADVDAKAGGWSLGYNPDGPSDKTVSVLKFESLSGKPIAIFINYSVHAVVMGPLNLEISGDLPGATSRFVEQYYEGKTETRGDAGWDLQPQAQEKVGGNGVVALWTSGPAGDQNPIVMDDAEDFSMVDPLGRILGEETVRVANNITTMSTQVKIWALQQVITCPGQTFAADLSQGAEDKFKDSKPVDIRISLLMLNKIALAGVSGEVLTPIFQRLKKESPFNDTIMVTHANGLSGYIPNDDAYNQVSYEIRVTNLKRGCAEGGIVNGFLNMMKQY